MDGGLRHVAESTSIPQRRVSDRVSRWIPHLALLLIDGLSILLGFAIAYWMRYLLRWPPPFDEVVREVATSNFVELGAFNIVALGLVLILLFQFEMRGLYRLPRSAGVLDHAGIIISSALTGIAIMIVVVFLVRPFYYSRLIFVFAFLTICTLLISWRAIYLTIQRWAWSRGRGLERVLVLGGAGLSRQVMDGIIAQPHLGLRLLGYLADRRGNTNPVSSSNGDDAESHARVPDPAESKVYQLLGGLADLERIVREQAVSQVLIALPFWEHHQLPQLVQICRNLGVEYRIAPDLYELSFDRISVHELSGIPLIDLKELSLTGWNLILKRAIDLGLVILAAPVLLPILCLIGLLIRLDSPGPALFTQTRVGRGGRLFTVYKFRTMGVDAEQRKAELIALNEADGPIFKIRRDPRITRIGRWLRRSSIDELPQLLNVLRGEMSLVGPRPYVPDEVARFATWHRRCLEVTPGLTGLWQVLGRSDTSFEERVRLDIYYAENWSLAMDLRIMLLTIPTVLSGKGAY